MYNLVKQEVSRTVTLPPCKKHAGFLFRSIR